jgi:hypothetical protein
LQFFARGRARFDHANPAVEASLGEFGEERGMAVGAERMAVTEPVSRQTFAGDQQNR